MSDEEPRGVGLDDLPGIYREGYLHSIEMARAQHDPAADWESFREYLWEALIRVFGLEIDGRWPDDVPHPSQKPPRSDAGGRMSSPTNLPGLPINP